MSYDISLIDPKSKETIRFDKPHNLKGGAYAFEGTVEASLNVTWNYSRHFCRVLGENGIRVIYGMSANESIPILSDAILKLKNDVSVSYWEATEGNARKALADLCTLAIMSPKNAIWEGV